MSQFEFDLFSGTAEPIVSVQDKSKKNQSLVLNNSLQQAILGYIITGKTSAREMCELLLKYHNAPSERYLTGRPKLYPLVCIFLDSLVIKGDLALVKAEGKEERIYKNIK